MKKQLTFKNDIRKKLLQFSILPILFLSIIFTIFIYVTLEKSYEDSHVRILKSIDYRLNTFFNDTLEKVKHLKKDDMKLSEISFMFKHSEEFDSIMIIDKNGIIKKSFFKNNKQSFEGFDYSNNKIFKRFLNNNKKPFFSNVYFSSLSNSRNISYIFEYKKFIYMINYNLKEFNKYIEYINKSFDGQIVVIDKNGKYIIDTSQKIVNNKSFFNTTIYETLINNENQYRYLEFYDEELKKDNFITFMINKDTSWIVALIDNSDDLDYILVQIISLVSLFVFILGLLILAGISKVTQKIVDPLYSITDQMDKLSNNEVSKTTYINGNIEYPMFKKIIVSFNIMQDKILEREDELINLNKNLEVKVAEKTLELEEINKNLQKRIEHEIKLNTQKERIFFEQSKMASMGEMIGNIAHQWRQPLSLISTVSSGLKFKYEMNMFNEDEYISSLDKILDSTTYLSNTIDDFRNFFKSDKEIVEFDINLLINKAINLMGNSFSTNNIHLELNVQKNLIKGYENELLQALLNILNNAKDALKDKEINKLISISTNLKEDKIIISIQDTAGGVPKNIINKIYEPYFTTKHQSQGTGIGLYMTKEIVVKHMQGKIEVKNTEIIYNENKLSGALFTITIPTILQKNDS
jgi:signal transduction histidine kinase